MRRDTLEIAMRRLLVAVVALAGCGDNTTGTPYELFDAEADAARCDYLTRCGLFADRAACDGFFRLRHDAGLEASVAVGKARYNGLAAAQCHAALANMSCDLSSREGRVQPEVCGRVVFGTLANDETCMFDQECLSGSCSAPVSCPPDMCCPGSCQAAEARSSEGGACETNAGCAGDTFCGADQLCHALGKAGAECRRDEECEFGSGCIGPTELMPGNCRELPKLGESCPYQRCAELNARCDAPSHTCMAFGLPGDACASDEQCSPFARCDTVKSVCANVPRLGEPCQVTCAGEAFCDLTTKMCLAPLERAAPCTADDQCSSLFCGEGPVYDACTDPQVCF